MTVEEKRLADWLQAVTPEPPRQVDVEQISARIAVRRRLPLWVPALAAAAVMILVAALAIGLSRTQHAAPPGHSARPGPSSSVPSPSTSRPSEGPVSLPVHPWDAHLVGGVALQPDTTAALAGRLYAVTGQAEAPIGTSRLVRLDPRTGQVLARSVGTVSWQVRPVLADGLVWTVGAGTTTVLGLDPDTLAEAARVTVSITGRTDDAVALNAGGQVSAVLLGAGRTVAFVDPDHIVRRLTVDGPVEGVALSPDGTRLYVVVRTSSGAQARVETLEADTGDQAAAPITTDPLLGPLATAGGLWDTWAGGHGAGIEFRPSDHLSSAIRPPAGTSGGGQDVRPSLGGGVAWLGGDGRLGCADPDTGALRASVPVGSNQDGSVLGYITGMTTLDGNLYAIFSGSVGGSDVASLIRMTPPAACFRH